MEVYMEGFYEQDREENGLAINRNGDHTFVPHYHANLEILLVKKGRYRVNVNENTYEVKDGCLLVVDSYDIHAYKKNLDGETFDTCVLVIPYEYLRKFNIWKRGKRIENPFLSNSELCGKLLQLIDGYLIGERNEKILEAGIDLFLSILCNQLHFVKEKSSGEVGLMRKILAYTHENFQQPLMRKRLSQTFGYTETHISKVFHRYMKTGISKYVNKLRLSYIDDLRRSGDERPLTELVYEAGFNSQRTYYRCRQQQ